MNIHIFMHVPFETPGIITEWAKKHNYHLSYTHLYLNQEIPDLSNIDSLIVMGGPMSVNDEKIYPWLKKEKEQISHFINSNKKVLGICLGSQLIADVLGSKVYKNTEKEIGWFKVELTKQAESNPIFKNIPKSLNVFHWHGETFDLPKEAVLLMSSAACKNQAYIYKQNVLAFQCHLEINAEIVQNLILNCEKELVESEKYIQNSNKIMELSQKYIQTCNSFFVNILDGFFN